MLIPTPILIGVPLLGVAALVYYEWSKGQSSSGAIKSGTTTVAPNGTTTVAPNGTTPSSPTGSLPVLGIKHADGFVTWLTPTGGYTQAPPAANPGQTLKIIMNPPVATQPSGGTVNPTNMNSIQAAATAALNALPSPFPNDPYGINAQIVKAALLQLVHNPTASQLQTTLAALQQNLKTDPTAQIAITALASAG
jgi:hypothetical protein